MLYSSRNGCFYYYDSILFRWQIAEPTLLFLLGLEAITSYDKSISDSIVISKYVYKTYIDKLEPLEYIHDVYDDIYMFLSKTGSVEDNEQYLKFNCYGLKLLLNDMTGTKDDRTVPFIFKYSKNSSLVDPKNELRADSKLSYYDIQAERIYDIFNDIGYDTSCEVEIDSSGKKHITPEYYINRNKENSAIKDIISALSSPENRALRATIINSIISYNDKITTVHKKRMSNSEIYRLLDYKAMYSYALGVLYGCRCLGFDDSIIWRVDPKFWYNDVYFNLVRTAWFVFRFHWTYNIKDVTDEDFTEEDIREYTEKYQAIQENKVWNFSNDEETGLINAPLAQDETNCYCLYLGRSEQVPYIQVPPSPDEPSDEPQSEPESSSEPISEYSTLRNARTVSEQFLYSYETDSGGELPGSFLRKYMSLKDGTITWKWFPIDEKVSDGDENTPMKGIVSTRDSAMTRYIGNDPVIIYRAYKYTDDSNVTRYLSPKYSTESEERYKKYYVYTGDLGWVDYTEDLLLDINHVKQTESTDQQLEPIHDYLNIVPKTPAVTRLSWAFPRGPNSDVPSVITYYKCYVTDHCSFNSDTESYDDNDSDILYGIFNKFIKTDGTDSIPNNFDYIISGKLFDAMYSEVAESYSGEYTTWYGYDLDEPITLIARKDPFTGIYYIWDGENTNPQNDIPVYYYGYSEKVPSTLLQLYNLFITDSEQPNKETFRYIDKSPIDSKHRYWSETYFSSVDNIPLNSLAYYVSVSETPNEEVRLLVSASTPGAVGNSLKLKLYEDSEDNIIIKIYNGESLTCTTSIASANVPSDKIDDEILNALTVVIESDLSSAPINNFVKFSGGIKTLDITSHDSESPLVIEFSGGSDSSPYGRTWRTLSELTDIGGNSNPLFNLTNKVTNIYKGETRLLSDTLLYNKYSEKASEEEEDSSIKLDEYIYCNINELLGSSETRPHNFVLVGYYNRPEDDINSLYINGITKHLCPYVLVDDDGNSLLDDDNNPLVWYDPEYDVYWNGLYNINRWQKTKPSRNSKSMYDAITEALIPVFDNMDEQLISIDGEDAITYDEFYSHPNYGVVREILQVFNPSYSATEIKECYCDTKLDPDDYNNALYCIPGITHEAWVSRSDIHSLGWWFVDGTATLYSGDEGEDVVVDDDHRD